MRAGRALPSLRRFLRSSSGNFVTLGALLFPAALTLAAFAVDQGSLYVERRQVQRLTDLAAIAAVSDIGHASDAASGLFRANGIGDLHLLTAANPATAKSIAVETGNYAADEGVAVGERFRPGETPINAARITVRTTGTRFFAAGLMPTPAIGASAIAASANEAAFSIGSRLASLDGGILNAVLGQLLGTSLSLSVMDYNALLNADIDVLGFFDALAGELDITAGTYDDVLQSDISVTQFVKALASVSGDADAKAALQAILAGLPAHSAAIPLSHVFSLGAAGRLALGERAPGLTAAADVMEMLTAGAAVADGEHQVALDLGVALPGLAGVSLDLAIGEPPQNSPWFAVGGRGEVVRTAQTRLSLVVQVGGAGALLGTRIRVPLYIELAFAEARLDDIACPTGRPDSLRVTVDARPGVAEAWIGEVDAAGMENFAKSPPVGPAKIVEAPLVKVTGKAHATIANPSPTPLVFSAADIAGHAVKKVSTHSFTGSLFNSLVGDLQLDVNVAGLDLGLGPVVRSTLLATLGTVSPAIDTLLDNVLAVLGVKVGEADVRVTGGVCGRAVLVQ